jgi:hypothetical protein
MEKFESIKIFERPKEEKEDVTVEKEPAIKEGEVFDPEEELALLKKMSSGSEKRDRLEKYKEKLAFQKERIAAMQEEIIERIRENPDISQIELVRLIIKCGRKAGLSDHQNDSVDNVIAGYLNAHKAVVDIKKRFGEDSRAAFEFLFSSKPVGRVDLLFDPVSIYFVCYDIKDYALIYNSRNRDSLSVNDINTASLSGGVSINLPRPHWPAGLNVTIDNASKSPEGYYDKLTRIHEEQHAIKKLFTEQMIRQDGLHELMHAENEEEIKDCLRRQMRYIREQFAESRAKDEILAYMKTGEKPIKVFSYLTDPKGLYAFIDIEDEKIFWDITISKIKHKRMKEIIEEVVDEVYVKEYNKLIEDGIASFVQLQVNGYLSKEVIALLINEPLSKWKKVVRRLLEAKPN